MNSLNDVILRPTHWYCNKYAEKYLLISSDIIAMMTAYFLSKIFMSMAKHQSIYQAFEALWTDYGCKRLWLYSGLIGLTIGAFWSKQHYSKRRPYWNELGDILKISLILMLIDSTLNFLGRWPDPDFAQIIIWPIATFLLIIMRMALKHFLTSIGGWVRPMVIIGGGGNAIETALAFKNEPLMGFDLAAFLIPVGQTKFDHTCKQRNGQPVPCVSLGKNPEHTLKSLGNPHVVLAFDKNEIYTFQDLIQQFGRQQQDMQIVPPLQGLPLYGMEINHFFSHEVLLLTIRNNLARRWPQLLKRIFDITASVFLLIIGSPVFLWIAAKVLASGGPLFYGHTRVGQNEKPFICYKFRTMLPKADKLLEELLARDPEAKAEWLRDFKLKNDPRITPIGQFLRKTSLDELPQLWNVLKGDMSLVGPRPIVKAELERYGTQVDYYLEAKPGITGLWQISGRNDVSYDTRVQLDAWYVKNWTFFNDIVILLKTVKVLLKRDCAY